MRIMAFVAKGDQVVRGILVLSWADVAGACRRSGLWDNVVRLEGVMGAADGARLHNDRGIVATQPRGAIRRKKTAAEFKGRVKERRVHVEAAANFKTVHG